MAPSIHTFQFFFKKSCSLKIKFARHENQKFHIFCLLRENLLGINKKEKSFLAFLYFPL